MGNTNCFLRVVPTLKHYSGIVRPYHMEEAIYSDILCTIFWRIQSGILSNIYFLTFSLASIWQFLSHSIWHSLRRLAEVRQCPLRSGVRGGAPAVPTEMLSSRLRPGSAYWDLEYLRLAVEVRQCPLRSCARGCGPALPTSSGPRDCHSDLELAAEPTAVWSSLVGMVSLRIPGCVTVVYCCPSTQHVGGAWVQVGHISGLVVDADRPFNCS